MSCLAAMLASAAVSQACLAQSAAPGATILEPMVVTASPGASPYSLYESLDSLAGGVALVTREDMPASGNLTVSKALASVSGVVVQDFFGANDQPRIQIRGSGLQQNPVERGILVLQNGLPINRADGSYIVGFANPRQADAIEIYRGYMANRLGASVLGGAMNFVSPTGDTAPGFEFEASGGSFGQIGAAGQAGVSTDSLDALIQFGVTRRDGYRDYNSSERDNVGGNVGFHLSDTVVTRVFAGYTDLGFDVAGPLSAAALESDPRQVSTGPTVTPTGPINPGPNVVRDRPRRDSSQFLVGTRTTAEFDDHLFDVGLGYTYTDDTFRFPIPSGIRVTEGGDATGVVRYAFRPDYGNGLPLFETTAQYTFGSADRENYVNQGGRAGAKFGESELGAATLSLQSAFNVPLTDTITISPAVAYTYATRDNDDTFDQPTRPTIAYNPRNPTMLLPNGAVPATDTSYSRSYSGWSPSLGLSWRPNDDHTLFAAISRSFEPPTHDDLLSTVNGTANSSPGRPNPGNPSLPAAAFATPDLEAQTSTTIEAGWRGGAGSVSWDAVAYYSWLENELLSLRDTSGAPVGAMNAGDTTHFGIELGLGAQFTEQVTGRIAYTYQDFRFDDDPVRGDNRLAGTPSHIIHAALQYRPMEDWAIQASLKWIPDETPVDNMNTLFADPYAVVGLRTEYRINDRFSVFGEATNLFDETYASSTLIVDQARQDQAAFLPGDGRAFYVGVTTTF